LFKKKVNFQTIQMTRVVLVTGSLFDSKLQTITNTINCVGAMGKGIALEFKNRFPKLDQDYRQRCAQRKVVTGKPYVFYSYSQQILQFPTKNHWRNPSQIEFIIEGLQYLVEHKKELNITSLAIPALGCNNGGLQWKTVYPIMVHYLEKLEIPVEIYAPLEIQQQIQKETKSNKDKKRKLECDEQQNLPNKRQKTDDFLPLLEPFFQSSKISSIIIDFLQ
jgi:O-acetyl-ADP-ribose deacetylase (regulator of RNase III)